MSDIHKIQEEVDTYYHISIVETLASTSFVSLPAEEVTIYPNIRPEHPKILGIPIPGFKVGSNPPAITGSPIPLINYLHNLLCLLYLLSQYFYQIEIDQKRVH